MLWEYLLIAAGIFVILLLITCIVLICLRRQSIINECILSEQVNALQASIEKNNEFFSNMVHELKTPLSVILGAIQLMELNGKSQSDKQSDETAARLERNLKIIKRNCYRLLRLTHNLLDLTRSEAGYQSFKPLNCDLDRLLEEIVLSVKPYAEEKQLKLYFKPSHQRNIVNIDIEKMERIMLNLLSNAIKFTNPGGFVCVSSYRSADRVYISVRDSGIGIPPEKHNEIFDRFKQASHTCCSENKGSGIGLSLVKSFVELHNGNINVKSECGKGSEFIIDLPAGTVITEAANYTASDLDKQISEAVKLEFSTLHSLST